MAINPNSPILPEMDIALLSGTGQFVPNSPGYPEIDITLLPGVPGQRMDYTLLPTLVAFTYTQAAASATWNITHNLHFKPNVTVFDSSGGMVEGNIVHLSDNSLTISFSAQISGTATLS